ncbi:MAG TPA: LysR substrate-binding domain-containing protein, partial [Pyrinomonadaceae bacterium]
RIGLGFVPRMCVAEELQRGSLVTVPVQDLSYERTLWATHRREMTFSQAAAQFLKLLSKQAKNQFRK